MPLSDPTSLYLTDLARRRLQAQQLGDTESRAVSGVASVLQQHDEQQKKEAQQANDNAMRLRQITDTETQQAVENDRANKEREARTAQGKLDYQMRLAQVNAEAQRANLGHFDEMRNAEANRAIELARLHDTEAQTTRTNTLADTEQKRADKQRALATALAAADPGHTGYVDADALMRIATETGATTDEVKQAAAEAKAASEKAALPAKQLEAENKRAANANWTQMQIAKMNVDERAKAAELAAAGKDNAANAKVASSLSDVADFKASIGNIRGAAQGVDGAHLATVLGAQKVAEKVGHLGVLGALGSVVGGAVATGQMTPSESKLVTDLQATIAKSVKGLEGAHRTVSAHQIEMVGEKALGALSSGDMANFEVQLQALERAADDTANAIRAEGMTPQEAAGLDRGAVATGQAAPAPAPAAATPPKRPNPF